MRYMRKNDPILSLVKKMAGTKSSTSAYVFVILGENRKNKISKKIKSSFKTNELNLLPYSVWIRIRMQHLAGCSLQLHRIYRPSFCQGILSSPPVRVNWISFSARALPPASAGFFSRSNKNLSLLSSFSFLSLFLSFSLIHCNIVKFGSRAKWAAERNGGAWVS